MDFFLRISSRVVEASDRAVDIEIEGVQREPLRFALDYQTLPPDFALLHRAAFSIEETRPLEIAVNAYFRRIEKWVKTEASVFHAQGLDIVQIQPTYILANFMHGRVEAGDGQCTVTCETTGESRSGRNVCVECPAGAGVIKICC